MAAKTFNINTKPHEANIGEDTFFFQPEILGAEFMSAYQELTEVQKRVTAAGVNAKADDFASITMAMREFLSQFMLTESAEKFAAVKLPDRVLLELIQWSAELYGGGQGKADPTGQSSGS